MHPSARLSILTVAGLAACGGGSPSRGSTDLASFFGPEITDGGMAPDGGAYDLAVTPLATNASCASAKPVAIGTSLSGEDTHAGGGPELSCLSFSSDGVLYYSLTVPARTQLDAALTPTGASWDPNIRVLATCGADSCLDSVDEGYDGDPETLHYKNQSATSQPVILAIAGAAGQRGTFDLSLSQTALGPAPSNDACAGAITLTDGLSLTQQDVTEGVDTLEAACLPSGLGGVLYYKATVPANSRLDVTVTPDSSGWDPVIRVLPACAATTCLVAVEGNQASYKNPGAGNATVVVAVGSYLAHTGGTFTLEAHIGAIPPTPPNLTCAAATAMSNGQTLLSQDLSQAVASLAAACLPSDNGPTLFYNVSVPVGQRLIASVTPNGSLVDAVIRLLDSCTTSSCLASTNAGAFGTKEAISYKNTGGSAKTLTIGISSTALGTVGSFDLSTWLRSAPSNTSRASAKAVSTGTSLVIEDGESATATSTQCSAAGMGKVLYYNASVPAGKTLTVTVTPVGYWDPVVRLADSCAATTCLVTQDDEVSTFPETLTYTNTGASTKSVIFNVGGYDASTLASNLAVTIQ